MYYTSLNFSCTTTLLAFEHLDDCTLRRAPVDRSIRARGWQLAAHKRAAHFSRTFTNRYERDQNMTQ